MRASSFSATQDELRRVTRCLRRIATGMPRLGVVWGAYKPHFFEALRNLDLPISSAAQISQQSCELLGAPVLVALRNEGAALFVPHTSAMRVFDGPLLLVADELRDRGGCAPNRPVNGVLRAMDGRSVEEAVGRSWCLSAEDPGDW